MPTLITAAISDNRPFIWTCSECNAAFEFGQITPNPSQAQIDKLNGEFQEHCKQKHPNSAQVVGLTPEGKDASQVSPEELADELRKRALR